MPLFAKVLDQKFPSHYTHQRPNSRFNVQKKLNFPSLYLTKNDWILMIGHFFYFKFQNPSVDWDLNGKTPLKGLLTMKCQPHPLSLAYLAIYPSLSVFIGWVIITLSAQTIVTSIGTQNSKKKFRNNDLVFHPLVAIHNPLLTKCCVICTGIGPADEFIVKLDAVSQRCS